MINPNQPTQLSEYERETLRVHHDFIRDYVSADQINMDEFWSAECNSCGCAIGWMAHIDNIRFDHDIRSPIKFDTLYFEKISSSDWIDYSLAVYPSILSYVDSKWEWLFESSWGGCGHNNQIKEFLLYRMQLAIDGSIPPYQNCQSSYDYRHLFDEWRDSCSSNQGEI